MREPLKVFIGYDDREPVAYHVLAHSILKWSSEPIGIYPVAKHQLRRDFTRTPGPTESTAFSLTRFMVPYLCGYEGAAIFMDCDMLCEADLNDLWFYILASPDKSVFCCQHDYIPKDTVKFLGQPQTAYPRKNWSSFMLFNNTNCKALTPDYVNHASGLDLHRFYWTDEDKIGTLPLEWNWLCGEYPPNPHAHVFHYTNGGPWFPETASCDHAERWLMARDAAMGTSGSRCCACGAFHPVANGLRGAVCYSCSYKKCEACGQFLACCACVRERV
jgi:hypothetical protein